MFDDREMTLAELTPAELTLAELAVMAESVTMLLAEDAEADAAGGCAPAVLDEVTPGPGLAQVLASLDRSGLSGHDRVTVLKARQRLANHVQADIYADMASVHDAYLELDEPVLSAEEAAAEIRAALTLTRRAAEAELSVALDLRARLPRLHELLATGTLDRRRAVEILTGLCHLSTVHARQVADRVLDDAPGLTTGQLRVRLRRLCLDTFPDDARERYEKVITDRRVALEPTIDGTAHLLGLDLPADRATAIYRRIDRIARTLRTGGESRSMDQLRADVYLDLLAGVEHSVQANLHITVDLDTLTGLAEHPGELAGYGPVIADIARHHARQTSGSWDYTVTDGGRPVGTGPVRRRPSAGQRRQVTGRDTRCVFPGCRHPAVDCDLDHTTPWADGGPTTPDNLAPLCRHDHRIRHTHQWTHQPNPDGGHIWTSPLGHTYTTSGQSP